VDQRRIDELREAIRRQPLAAELHNELGIAHAMRGEHAAAKGCFEQALRLRPAYPVAWQNLSRLLLLGGAPQDAELAALRAVAYAPADPVPQRHLGQLLKQIGRVAEAAVVWRNAWNLAQSASPTPADAIPNPPPPNASFETALASDLATLLQEVGDSSAGLIVVEQALRRHPHDIPLRELRAVLLRGLRREDDAEREYRAVLELRPDSPATRANLAHLLADQGRTEDARAQYAEADRLSPNPRVRIALSATLPVILDSRDDISRERDRLRQLVSQRLERGDRVDTTLESMPNLFSLAYHGQDDRWFHEHWSSLATPVDWLAGTPRPAEFGEPRRAAGRSGKGCRVRVGVLSRYLRDHTIGRLNLGWIERLPRTDIELVLLPVGPSDDMLARRYRAAADQFVPLPWSVPGALGVLRSLRLDVLLFLDVGMDPVTLALAANRVAPRQAATWGHPVTTGLPTIDDFLSAETAELPGADAHYTERLIRFSRLGVCYERPSFDPALSSKRVFGVDDAWPLLACPQSLFKFHPDFDEALSRIMERLPTARLALIDGRHPGWRAKLEARWGRLGGPDFRDRVVWLPPQPRERFLGLLQAADVALDTFPFCGGNSSYETLAAGTPLVTLPTDLLRGRLTRAMYAQLDWTELVATDAEDYTQKVLRLVQEPDYAAECRREIATRADQLFNDQTAVTEWERYLTTG
jgi:protein O-GlcNAc transferase